MELNMSFKKNKKTWFAIITVSVFFFSFSALGYVQRLRNALISSTEIYKIAIIELENKTIKLENKINQLENKELHFQEEIAKLENQFQKKITKLENKIIAQGVHVTNDISINYELEVNPSSITLNNILVRKENNLNSVRFIVAGHPYGNPTDFSPDNLGATAPSGTLVNFVSDILV